MIGILVFASIIGLIVSIIMIVKFFQIASDMRTLKTITLNDYQLKLLTSSANCQLLKMIEELEFPEFTIMEEITDWVQVKLGEGVYAIAEKEFGLWYCVDHKGQKFYSAAREDIFKALYYFQTQK